MSLLQATSNFLETLLAVYSKLEHSWLCSLWLTSAEALQLSRLDLLDFARPRLPFIPVASSIERQRQYQREPDLEAELEAEQEMLPKLTPEDSSRSEHEPEQEACPASRSPSPLGIWSVLASARVPIRWVLADWAVLECVRADGWVTRPGAKFGTDLLLYRRGPEYCHSEFALRIVHADGNGDGVGDDEEDTHEPAITSAQPQLHVRRRKLLHDWRSLIALNRVAESTCKQLLLADVRWRRTDEETAACGHQRCSSDRSIVRHTTRTILTPRVQLVAVSRWMPETMRSGSHSQRTANAGKFDYA